MLITLLCLLAVGIMDLHGHIQFLWRFISHCRHLFPEIPPWGFYLKTVVLALIVKSASVYLSHSPTPNMSYCCWWDGDYAQDPLTISAYHVRRASAVSTWSHLVSIFSPASPPQLSLHSSFQRGWPESC